jgi:hypothetical protein
MAWSQQRSESRSGGVCMAHAPWSFFLLFDLGEQAAAQLPLNNASCRGAVLVSVPSSLGPLRGNTTAYVEFLTYADLFFVGCSKDGGTQKRATCPSKTGH